MYCTTWHFQWFSIVQIKLIFIWFIRGLWIGIFLVSFDGIELQMNSRTDYQRGYQLNVSCHNWLLSVCWYGNLSEIALICANVLKMMHFATPLFLRRTGSDHILFLAATNQLYEWYFLSVRLSVCLSVCHTFLIMFPSSYHHEIFRSYHIGPG